MSIYNGSLQCDCDFQLPSRSGLLASRTRSFAFVYIGYLGRCMRPLFLCFFLLELELINLQLQLAARDCMTVYLTITTITDAHSE
jgi:hypothetical protein